MTSTETEAMLSIYFSFFFLSKKKYYIYIKETINNE